MLWKSVVVLDLVDSCGLINAHARSGAAGPPQDRRRSGHPERLRMSGVRMQP